MEGHLPWTSVTEVCRRGLAGEGTQGVPTGIPRWEEDISGRYTGKCRQGGRMFPFDLPFPFSLEVVQPGLMEVWQYGIFQPEDLGKVCLHS